MTMRKKSIMAKLSELDIGEFAYLPCRSSCHTQDIAARIAATDRYPVELKGCKFSTTRMFALPTSAASSENFEYILKVTRIN